MYSKKPLPKTQHEILTGKKDDEYSRANDIRRDNDKIKELSIGLYDIDNAIKWYFDNVIRPDINDFGRMQEVPVIYGSPEKWKNVQADGYFRDKLGKIQAPLIAYKRTGITKNKTLGSKVDANTPAAYYTQEVKYTQENRYDQFSVLTNSKPIKTFINTVVPEYVDVTYDIIIWTDFVEHMNKIVESIIYTEGSFWGEKDKFRFRTKIDNFTNTTDLLLDNDRIVRTNFTLTLFGYLVPDALAKELSNKLSPKTFDARQVVLEVDPDAPASTFTKTQEAVNNRIIIQGPITGSI
jgi:hypothetical protein